MTPLELSRAHLRNDFVSLKHEYGQHWPRRADALDVGENLAAEAAAKKEKTLQRYQSLFPKLGFKLKFMFARCFAWSRGTHPLIPSLPWHTAEFGLIR